MGIEGEIGRCNAQGTIIGAQVPGFGLDKLANARSHTGTNPARSTDSVTILNNMTSSDTALTIARRVAEFRKRKHFSLDQLAERARLSKGALSGLEKGNGNPSIALLCQTAAALRVSVSDLLDESPSNDGEQFDFKGGKSLWRAERRHRPAHLRNSGPAHV